MRYWALVFAKLLAVWGVLSAVAALAHRWRPRTDGFALEPFGHHLSWTFAVLLFWLLGVGLIALAVWDQKYRCRTCLRRLRMPVNRGSYPNTLLKGSPRTEYICVYGHGTLQVPEVHLSSSESADWRPHEDIWTELTSPGRPEK